MVRFNERSRTVRMFASVAIAAMILTACGSSDSAAPATPAPAPTTPGPGQPAEPAPIENFWAGKTLEFIIPTSAGGGTNRQARFFSSLLPDLLPGNPSVQPTNFPGAGGSIGGNLFAHRRDHSIPESIFISSGSSFMPWMFGNPQMLLDYDDLVGLIAIPASGAVYVDPRSTGITSPEDFIAKAKDVNWILGAQAPDGADLPEILAFDLLGLTNRAVMGFQGSGPQRLAFEAGELNANADPSGSWGSVQPMIDDNRAVAVFSYGALIDGELRRDPIFPDLPHMFEVYERMMGRPISGIEKEAYTQVVLAAFGLQKMVWVHSSAPEEAIRSLRQAFVDMASTQAFLDGKDANIGEGIDVLVGDDAIAAAETMTSGMAPETREWLIDYMVTKHGYVDTRIP